VLAKLLALRPERIAGIEEAAMVSADGVVRTTARWDEVARQ